MQKAVNLVLGLAVAGLAVAVAALALDRPAPPPSEATLRDFVAEAVAAERASGEPAGSVADREAEIESYLLANPRILQDLSAALQAELTREEAETTRAALANLQTEIYDDPDNIVLGNPDGDVTLVELFDYNCTYCRQVVPDVLELIAEDPDLRVILKEFPILSADSVAAARVGLQVNRSAIDYAMFHTALMSGRGTVTAASALEAAGALGLNRTMIEAGMGGGEITGALERTYAIAQSLGITGTPSFIIGNEVIPGAVGKEALALRIANMRACGQTVCPPAGGGAS